MQAKSLVNNNNLFLPSLFIEKLPKHRDYKTANIPEKKDTLKVLILFILSFIRHLNCSKEILKQNLIFLSSTETKGRCLSSSRNPEKSSFAEIWTRAWTVSCQKGKLSNTDTLKWIRLSVIAVLINDSEIKMNYHFKRNKHKYLKLIYNTTSIVNWFYNV